MTRNATDHDARTPRQGVISLAAAGLKPSENRTSPERSRPESLTPAESGFVLMGRRHRPVGTVPGDGVWSHRRPSARESPGDGPPGWLYVRLFRRGNERAWDGSGVQAAPVSGARKATALSQACFAAAAL